MRRHAFALFFIAAAIAVLFLPAIVKREVFTLRDHTDYFQPLRFFTATHLQDLRLPYWNPYSASGEPWLANPQTGVFYPPSWLFLVFPFETAYMLYLAAHLLILGIGTYVLLTRFVSESAALVGATAVVFSGPVLSLVDVSNNLATFAWIPWVIWSGVARVAPALAGLLIALSFLGGEPFFAATGAMLYTIVLLSGGGEVPEGRRRIAANAATVMPTALVAVGLCAIQLVPFLELIAGSDRAARLTSEEIFRESMALRDWLRIVIPPRLGASAYDPALSQHFIPVVYCGIAVVVLAAMSLILVRRRAVAGWSLLLIVAIVVAAGNHLPTGSLFESLPVTPFRYPSRAVPFGALAIAALAALGWDRVRPKRRWVDLILIAIVIADLLPRSAPLLRTEPFRAEVSSYPGEIGRDTKFLRVQRGPMGDRQSWMAGYINLYERRFDAWTAAPVVADRYAKLYGAAVPTGHRDLLAFLGAGHVLTDAPMKAVPIARAGNVKAYSVPTRTQMAAHWTAWRSASSSRDAFDTLLRDATRGGIPIAGAGASSVPPGDGAPVAPERLVIDTKSVRATINAPHDGVFVLTQQDAPSWRVFVDGVEREKLLAGGIFRAVLVPRGRHEVEWRFIPSSLRVGATMTFITALFLSMIFFVKRARTKKIFFVTREN